MDSTYGPEPDTGRAGKARQDQSCLSVPCPATRRKRGNSLDTCLVQLRRPDAPSRAVESLSEAAVERILHRTPFGRVSARRAVRPDRLAALLRALFVHASGVGVERHPVRIHAVRALDDVDLAVVGPVEAARPERRPDGAPCGDMDRVEDDHAPDRVERVRAQRNLC